MTGTMDDPYIQVIARFLHSEIGGSTDTPKGMLLDILTDTLVGSNNVRYGPRPSPEQLVSIREVITYSTRVGTPIPLLVPWGSRKPNLTHSVDVAELMGLRALVDLDTKVRRHYAPGILANIRVEDTNALYLFRRDKGNAPAVLEYWLKFSKLAQIVAPNTVTIKRESELMAASEYLQLIEELTPTIYEYLQDTEFLADSAIRLTPAMVDIGWKGSITHDQRDYYLSRYKALYPDEGPAMHNQRLAEYFAGSLARYRLGGTGASNAPFITLSFVPPVPGTPTALERRRIYYRTLPASAARTHIPAWRAKGYLRIGDGDVTPKITAFSTLPEDLHPCTVKLTSEDGECSLDLQTDYMLV